jgi:hypothetical protein
LQSETKEKIGDAFENAEDAAEEIVRRPWVRALSGCGFYAKGILFLMIGTSAVFLSAGIRGGRIVDPTGALNAVGQLNIGAPLLFFLALGAAGHGIWNILRGVADIDDLGKGVVGIIARSLAVCMGVFYLFLSLFSAKILLAGASENANSEVEQGIAQLLLSLPLGILIVLILGLGFAGAGLHELYSGLMGKYQENYRLWQIGKLDHAVVSVLGVISFVTRAIIYLLIGYFFLSAVFLLDASQAEGFDGALLSLAQNRYGGILLFAAGFGLVCHGILAFFEAKYRRIC